MFSDILNPDAELDLNSYSKSYYYDERDEIVYDDEYETLEYRCDENEDNYGL